MDINKLYNDYVEFNNITQKQINFIKKLIDKLINNTNTNDDTKTNNNDVTTINANINDDTTTNNDTTTTNNDTTTTNNDTKTTTNNDKIYIIYINNMNILEENIVNLEGLTKMETNKLINKLKNISPASKKQIEVIKKMDINIVNNIIDKDLDLLNINDVNLIFNKINRLISIKETPIISNYNWEYGLQLNKLYDSNKFYYLKFYNLLVLDYDNITLDNVKKLLLRTNLTFRIYETFKGYHVFCTSMIFDYHTKSTINFMRYMLCDEVYSTFVYRYGFKVRLTKKHDNEQFIARYIEKIGNEDELDELLELINVHDYYINEANQTLINGKDDNDNSSIDSSSIINDDKNDDDNRNDDDNFSIDSSSSYY